MIGGYAWLQSVADEDFTGAIRIAGRDLENRPIAVADEEVAVGVEGRSGGHDHAFGVDGGLTARVDAVDGALGARSDEEIAFGIECEARRVEDSADEGSSYAIGADAHDRNRRLLAALTGDGGEGHSGTAYDRAGHRMQAVGKLTGDVQRNCVAGAIGGANFDQAGGGLLRHAEAQLRVAAHEHMCGDAINQRHRRGGQTGAEVDAAHLHVAAGQGRCGNDAFDHGREQDLFGKPGHRGHVHLNPAVQIQRCRRNSTAQAYNPAATSSKTMPQPSGSFSMRRMGNGLRMSKMRKSRNATAMCCQSGWKTAPSRVIQTPATSSMTTKPGSLRPLSRAAMVAAGTPSAIEKMMPPTVRPRSVCAAG